MRRPLRRGSLTKSEYAFDELFERNGWPVAWHNGIYPFTHYHSKTHEVLGIARGEATVQFGGKSGKILTARAGDAFSCLQAPGTSGSPQVLISSSSAPIHPVRNTTSCAPASPTRLASGRVSPRSQSLKPIRSPALPAQCSASGSRIKLTEPALDWHNKRARCSETKR